MFDKFHEECGVVAVYGHPEAAKLAYLGLYALQHRGQESAGIATSDGRRDPLPRRPWATWRTSSPAPCWPNCPAHCAIGHTRYSTAGDTACSTRSRSRCSATRAASRWRTTATSPTPRNCARELERRGLHLPGLQRHRSDPAPGGALARAHAGRRAARGAAATGGRVLAGVSGRGPRDRGARPATASARSPWARWNSPAAASATCSPPKPAPST